MRRSGCFPAWPETGRQNDTDQDIADRRQAVYLDMERVADRQILNEPDLYLDEQAGRLEVIDEIQRMPDLFTALREQIDRRRRHRHRSGQFLLLGSASNALLRQNAESLAGRVRDHELTPFMLQKVGVDALTTLWLRGGFSDSSLLKTEAASFRWRDDFIRTYLERDIPAFGLRILAETLRRFWAMLAHGQGGILIAVKEAGNLDISAKSVTRYLDVLVDLTLIRRLSPWRANAGKRLVKSPKIYGAIPDWLRHFSESKQRNICCGIRSLAQAGKGFVLRPG